MVGAESINMTASNSMAALLECAASMISNISEAWEEPQDHKASSPTFSIQDLENIEKDILSALKRLETTIQTRLAALRVRRNALTPICKLPADIILIFIDYTTSPSNSPNVGTLRHPIFQFNQRFRNIALSSPSVWSRIWATDAEDARILVKRSQGTLLDVLGGTRAWHGISAHQDRCKHIRYLCLSKQHKLPAVNWDASATELLSLETCGRNNDASVELGVKPLFGGQAPKLRKLHISWLPHVADPVLSRITVLELCHAKDIDRETLGNLLNACAVLEQLGVSDSTLAEETTEKKSSLVVNSQTLPSLKQLLIADSTRNTVCAPQCLGRFLLPLCSTLSSLIKVSLTFHIEEDIPTISSHHSSMVSMSPSSPALLSGFRDLEITHSQGITIKYSNNQDGEITMQIPHKASEEPKEDTFLTELYQLLSDTPLYQTQSLTLTGSPCSEIVIPLLTSLSDLSSLRIGFETDTIAEEILGRLALQTPDPVLLRLSELYCEGRHGRGYSVDFHAFISTCLESRKDGPWRRLSKLVVPAKDADDKLWGALAGLVDELILEELESGGSKVIKRVYTAPPDVEESKPVE